MGKCLVTSFNTSIDNEELYKIDEMKILLENIRKDGDISVRFTQLNGTYLGKPAALRIIGATFSNGTKRYENPYSGGDSSISNGVSIPNNATAFIVENKYKLTGISCPLESIGNISLFKYLTNLHHIRTYSREWTGNLSSLSKLVNLEFLELPNNKYITGDIKTLADSMVASGRTSGTLQIQANGEIKNNGASINASKKYKITFNGSSNTIEEID